MFFWQFNLFRFGLDLVKLNINELIIYLYTKPAEGSTGFEKKLKKLNEKKKTKIK